jgi:phage gpG-like protein
VPVNLRFAFQGDEQVNRTLEAIENRGQDAIPLWEELANRFLDLEERQFDSEGAYASGGWEPLSPPYAAWKLDHYPGTHILERTGDLKASLTDGPGVRVLTSRAMWIGSDVDYGQFHQRGDGVPQRRPVELPEDERELWVRLTHRYLVTGEVGP